MTATLLSIQEILDLPEGHDFGWSEPVLVSQKMIQAFADVTGDHQPLHLDEEIAAAGPFGTRVAHGYLTLALGPMLMWQMLEFPDTKNTLNGKCNCKFTGPVASGSEVRLGMTLGATKWRRRHRAAEVTLNMNFEVVGAEKPVIVAENTFLLFPSDGVEINVEADEVEEAEAD